MVAVVVLVVLVAVLLVLVGARDVRKRRRTEREWAAMSTAALAARVDVTRLARVRRDRGELVAIKELRTQLPGCPLLRARDLVAELTGVPTGSPG